MLNPIKIAKGKSFGDVYIFECQNYELRLRITNEKDYVSIKHKNEDQMFAQKYPRADVYVNGVLINAKFGIQNEDEIDECIDVLNNYKDAIELAKEILKNRQEIITKYAGD